MVNATFGTVEYREGGVIAVPVTFGENVIAPSKSIFEVKHISGDALTDIGYRLIGKNTAFELLFEIPPDRSGSFQITANGDVFKVSNSTWDNIAITAKTVNYGTLAPRIVDYDIPENYTVGEKFDVKIDVGTVATGLHANNVQDVFILEGAANLMGTPTPYKWTGTKAPNLQTVLPDALTGTDWQQLTAPPAGKPTPGRNNFDADGQWHGESGQYFLVRWTVDKGTTGIFSMTLRENMLRGPTG